MQFYRVGVFFILVGALLLMLFGFAVNAGAEISVGVLLWGLLALALGVFIYFRFPKPKANPSGRFRVLKKKPPRAQRSRRGEEGLEDEDRGR
jgi:predicted membrane channel-forming protein YqfA (hemolysin III family)